MITMRSVRFYEDESEGTDRFGGRVILKQQPWICVDDNGNFENDNSVSTALCGGGGGSDGGDDDLKMTSNGLCHNDKNEKWCDDDVVCSSGSDSDGGGRDGGGGRGGSGGHGMKQDMTVASFKKNKSVDMQTAAEESRICRSGNGGDNDDVFIDETSDQNQWIADDNDDVNEVVGDAECFRSLVQKGIYDYGLFSRPNSAMTSSWFGSISNSNARGVGGRSRKHGVSNGSTPPSLQHCQTTPTTVRSGVIMSTGLFCHQNYTNAWSTAPGTIAVDGLLCDHNSSCNNDNGGNDFDVNGNTMCDDSDDVFVGGLHSLEINSGTVGVNFKNNRSNARTYDDSTSDARSYCNNNNNNNNNLNTTTNDDEYRKLCENSWIQTLPQGGHNVSSILTATSDSNVNTLHQKGNEGFEYHRTVNSTNQHIRITPRQQIRQDLAVNEYAVNVIIGKGTGMRMNASSKGGKLVDSPSGFLSLLRQHRQREGRRFSLDHFLRLNSVASEDSSDGSHSSGERPSENSSMESISVASLSLLCAERVSQMTKTYNDIEAVSRLLEEKERDLELAARIGQTLLSKNKELSARNECLDEQLSLAHDKVNQLRHDLSVKEELLRFVNENMEETDDQIEATPGDQSDESLINADLLQKKVDILENENVNLRVESANLKSATTSYEEKEKKLVEDCIKQLAQVNCQVETFAEELHNKSEENENQREQITKFLTQVADLQIKIRKLTVDNMELHDKLSTSTDSQRKLTKELGSMQDKYDELYEMLEEAQQDLSMMRNKHKIRGTDRHHQNAFNVPTDSLASELETSLQQELDQSARRAQSWKIFETARAAKRAVAKVTNSSHNSSSCKNSLRPPPSLSSLASYQNSPLSSRSLRYDSDGPSLGYSAYTSDGESMVSDGYTADLDSLYGSTQELGRPGIPGSNDLESALRRLVLRRDGDRDFDDDESRKGSLKNRLLSGSQQTPPTPSTPRVFPSTGCVSTPSSSLSHQSYYSPSHGPAATFKSSDKLKIMKPLEGSVTLRHWQHLATPHLGGIFEPREGVKMKGARQLDTEEEVMYRLSDFEEDENLQENQRDNTRSTLVNSLIDAAVRSRGPSISRDWPKLQDPRTPSPGLAFYNQSPSHSTFNYKPMQASTPVLNSTPLYPPSSAAPSPSHSISSNAISNCDSMAGRGSLGLAEILERRGDGISASITRAAIPVSKKNSSYSKQDLNVSSSIASLARTLSSVVSVDSGKGWNSSPGLAGRSSSLDVPSVSSQGGSVLLSTQNLISHYRHLPGSRSAEEISTDSSIKVTTTATASSSSSFLSSLSMTTTTTTSTDSADKNSWVFSPGMTGQGFLNQLKNRGYSLYGLWANATAAASSKLSETLSTDLSEMRSKSSGQLSLGLKSEASSSDVDGQSCSGSSSSSGRRRGFNLIPGSHSVLDSEDQSPTHATTTAITTTTNSEHSLPSGGGMFGAYASFRRGGIL